MIPFEVSEASISKSFSDDGICSFHEIRNFYEKFIGIPADKVGRVAKEGYRAMTAVSED